MSFMRRPVATLALALLSLCAWSAHASESAALAPAAASASALPEAITHIVGVDARATQTFDTPAGFTGWVIERGDMPPVLLYTTADGKYALMGNLVGADGRNLTSEYGEKFILEPMWPRIGASTFIAEGATNPTQIIYAVMDPNCIYCHILWQALQPYEQEGLQVRWIPVGVVKPDSAGKAAAILEAPDPVAALKAAHAGYVEKTESAGIEPVPVTPQTQAKLLANLHLAERLGMRGTPMILFKDHTTGKIVVLGGLPKLGTLGVLLGLPQQASVDPSLKRHW